jgi:lycopene cyclase domain-containing protein
VTYTTAAALAVLAVAAIDLFLLRTSLLRQRVFWASYAIVLFFQLVVNGLLTGLKIVRYDPATILGPRIAFAPVEDLLFGFAMVLITLSTWEWTGRLAARRGRRADPAGPRPPGAAGSRGRAG